MLVENVKVNGLLKPMICKQNLLKNTIKACLILDINECTSGSATCALNAECTNTRGSYVCTCRPGYQGDGQSCNGMVRACMIKLVNSVHIIRKNKNYFQRNSIRFPQISSFQSDNHFPLLPWSLFITYVLSG